MKCCILCCCLHAPPHGRCLKPAYIFYYIGSLNLFIPLKAELNPFCHLLALLGAHPILHVSRVRVILKKNVDNLFFFLQNLVIHS